MQLQPVESPTFYPVLARTYSRRKADGSRESWNEVCDRSINALADIGKFTPEEKELCLQQQQDLIMTTAGRWLWVAGTQWLEKPENWSGAFNCTGTAIDSIECFGDLMNLAMMGCGTGANLSLWRINKLPVICNRLEAKITVPIGGGLPEYRFPYTKLIAHEIDGNPDKISVTIRVGDSRQGWVKAYQELIKIATEYWGKRKEPVLVKVDLGWVRPAGEKLKGFGGIANPVKLPELFGKIADILNGAVGRQLNSLECCLLIDEAAKVVVAGNVRRSAGLRQFDSGDRLGASAKDNLWQQDEQGNWRVDPERDALRMANHTRVFHRKPTLEECLESVRKQYYSGEGAIEWAGEAIAAANADLLPSVADRINFLSTYNELVDLDPSEFLAKQYFRVYKTLISDEELEHRMNRFGGNPCQEIKGHNFHCNLSCIHLDKISPVDWPQQVKAFTVGAIAVAALLQRGFTNYKYQKSREIDPIVAVNFTGLFDFFVNLFGVDWLKWWEAGRPRNWRAGDLVVISRNQGVLDRYSDSTVKILAPKEIYDSIDWSVWKAQPQNPPVGEVYLAMEKAYLRAWQKIVINVVWNYCDRHHLKRPNRCTAVQPGGTKSLLTNASPGWHPPKSAHFIRRITFAAKDPVALACLDYGYSIIPGQSDKDENGNLLTDPFDPRCTEWLVEIPVATNWADLPGADQIDINKFSAIAQFDFFMQVQQNWSQHNTSATIELRESEIETLGARIYEAIRDDEGYISAALLARFDDLQTFPRMPFEPISKGDYQRLSVEAMARRKSHDFQSLLVQYDNLVAVPVSESGPAGCDSEKCLIG